MFSDQNFMRQNDNEHRQQRHRVHADELPDVALRDRLVGHGPERVQDDHHGFQRLSEQRL